MKPASGTMQNGIHRLPLRVYYEDTDFSGVVYHASYLRFFERGRTEMLRALGVMQGELFEATKQEAGAGFAFMVRAMQIDFLRSARVDDVLIVETQSGEIKGASLMLNQRMLREAEVICTACVKVAFVAAGKAGRIPQSLRNVMQGA